MFYMQAQYLPYSNNKASLIPVLLVQQAVTQSRVLVDTVAVNMTWKAPVRGLKNVSFW